MTVHIGWVVLAFIGGGTIGLFFGSAARVSVIADERIERIKASEHLADNSESQGPQPPAD